MNSLDMMKSFEKFKEAWNQLPDIIPPDSPVWQGNAYEKTQGTHAYCKPTRDGETSALMRTPRR